MGPNRPTTIATVFPVIPTAAGRLFLRMVSMRGLRSGGTVATLPRNSARWDQTDQLQSPLFFLSSRPEQAAFSCAWFLCAACGVEGPWQPCRVTQLDGTKPTDYNRRRFSCHPDRSDPALSCARSLCAGLP